MPGERRVAFGVGLGLLRRPVCVERNLESTTISHRTAVSPVGTKPVVGDDGALLFGEIAVDEHSTVRAPAHRDLAPSAPAPAVDSALTSLPVSLCSLMLVSASARSCSATAPCSRSRRSSGFWIRVDMRDVSEAVSQDLDGFSAGLQICHPLSESTETCLASVRKSWLLLLSASVTRI